jgi:hypothetical protein
MTTPVARGSKTAVGQSRKRKKFRRRFGRIVERLY